MITTRIAGLQIGKTAIMCKQHAPHHGRMLCRQFSKPSIDVTISDAGIAHMVLQNFSGKNSFSKAMMQEFDEVVKLQAQNNRIRCLILRSDVPKIFCAGADLKERLLMPDEEVADFVSSLRRSVNAYANLPFPTIAAVEGIALGGGLELMLASDLRVVGTNALVGLSETALAIIPGAGGSQRLPRIVGVAKAKELIYTAARLTGQQASEIGLVHYCVPAGSAIQKAEELALSIADKGPIAIRMAKKSIDLGSEMDLQSALEIERLCYAELVPTNDRKEGLKAFLEKRKPDYKGN